MKVTLLACACMASAVMGAAQEKPREADKIVTTTRMVLVDVVVKDRQGKAIPGLTARDFQLLEDGKPQEIRVVDVTELPTAAVAPADPDVYSNVPAPNASRGPALIVLLDTLNTRFANQAFMRKAMLDYLEKHAPPGQPMAVFVLANGLTLVQDFNSDPRNLLKAITLVKGETPLIPIKAADEVARSISAPAEVARAFAGLGDLAAFAEGGFARIRGQITQTAMEAIAKYARAIPGRKALVWFSEEFPTNIPRADEASRVFNPKLQELANLFSDAQVAVYPADTQGLVAYAPLAADLPHTRGPAEIGNYTQSLNRDHWYIQRAITGLAEATGGRALINRNDLDMAFELAVADNGASYLLAYYPTNKDWSGKFRKIVIRVPERAAKVQHRSGYYGTVAPADAPDDFREAVLAGNPERGVLFQARVGAAKNGTRTVEFFVHGATLQKRTDDQQFDLDVQIMTLAAGRKPVVTGTRNTHTKLTPEELAKASGAGVLYAMDVPVTPDIKRLRLAVRDNVSKKYGVIEVPLFIASETTSQ
jgi:VWFA-related protein